MPLLLSEPFLIPTAEEMEHVLSMNRKAHLACK